MKPFDPRLVKQVPATRVPVLVLGVLGGLSGVAAIASAFAVAALVVALVRSQSLGGPALAVVVVFVVRGVLALALVRLEQGRAQRRGQRQRQHRRHEDRHRQCRSGRARRLRPRPGGRLPGIG